ncbi:hypothetical protein [Methylobacterium oryzisoli]
MSPTDSRISKRRKINAVVKSTSAAMNGNAMIGLVIVRAPVWPFG